MKLRLLCVGKLSEPWLREGVALYSERIGRYLPFVCEELREARGGGSHGDIHYGRNEEGERLLQRITPRSFVVILDEHGRSRSSEEWAGIIEQQMVTGGAEIVVVIGGAYGLSDAVKARGDLLLSLSAMTLPHQLARLVLLEQTYRGLTIIRREPYHNR